MYLIIYLTHTGSLFSQVRTFHVFCRCQATGQVMFQAPCSHAWKEQDATDIQQCLAVKCVLFCQPFHELFNGMHVRFLRTRLTTSTWQKKISALTSFCFTRCNKHTLTFEHFSGSNWPITAYWKGPLKHIFNKKQHHISIVTPTLKDLQRHFPVEGLHCNIETHFLNPSGGVFRCLSCFSWWKKFPAPWNWSIKTLRDHWSW